MKYTPIAISQLYQPYTVINRILPERTLYFKVAFKSDSRLVFLNGSYFYSDKIDEYVWQKILKRFEWQQS